jgi:hypothetical protein
MAKRWMNKLGYCWVKKHCGMYVNGHEREDVVQYQQSVFLPAWYKVERHMQSWTNNNEEEPSHCPSESGCCIVAWFHDESVFYAHDHQESYWVKEGSSPEPYAKGKGPSLMVADFVSADYGFLYSCNSKESVHVIFKPGKNCDGYFTNKEIIEQAEKAIEILAMDYPDEDHILIYNNATTCLKCADNALSTWKMHKNTSKEETNWEIEVNAKGPDGKNIYGPNGKLLKMKIRMGHGTLKDGSSQDFYFPDNHPQAGVFKGMAKILEERGYGNMSKIHAECTGFKCDPEVSQCCCWRILYNEPDFMNVKSLLQRVCEAQGFKVLFLPKFHCELNFIEMCWGHAKQVYCLYPPSSKEEDLKKNMLSALETILLQQM